MWTPGHLNRSLSSHSVAMSVSSSYGSTYAESIEEEHHFSIDDDLWQPNGKSISGHTVTLDLTTDSRRRYSASTQNSSSTLALDPAEVVQQELDLKTPTVGTRLDHPAPPEGVHNDANHTSAGPMEQLLRSLFRKVTDAERRQPTIMAEDYARLRQRVDELEAENHTWAERYQTYFAVRDEDLTNLLKVRDLLAQERREHAAMRQLRDEDLENVLMLREKLAKATWSRPSLARSASTSSARQSRTEGDDLWRAAKTAAMEHRILELEAANEVLRAQIATSSNAKPAESTLVVARMETMFEDSLKYREKMATRVQQLRSEKDALQKEVAALEDRNLQLEAKLESSQRRIQ